MFGSNSVPATNLATHTVIACRNSAIRLLVLPSPWTHHTMADNFTAGAVHFRCSHALTGAQLVAYAIQQHETTLAIRSAWDRFQ